jgi:hypothetical protein
MNDEVRRINEFIAERVMGWHKHETNGLLNGIKPIKVAFWYNEQDDLIMQVDRYDPLHNVAQAIEAARTWCDKHRPSAWQGEELFLKSPLHQHCATIAWGNNTEDQVIQYGATLPVAICSALEEVLEIFDS